MIRQFKVYSKMFEVLNWLFPKVNTFPKKQRFVLGQQIENAGLRCLRYIIEANNEQNVSRKIALLTELNTELEVLRSLLRLSSELGFMTPRSLGYIIGQIDEVGSMRGGWAKRYKLPPAQ